MITRLPPSFCECLVRPPPVGREQDTEDINQLKGFYYAQQQHYNNNNYYYYLFLWYFTVRKTLTAISASQLTLASKLTLIVTSKYVYDVTGLKHSI